LPRGLNPALARSLQSGVEQAINAMGLDLSASVLSQADDLALLIMRLTQPDAGLIEERVLPRRTMQAVFEQGEWLTSEDINRLQAHRHEINRVRRVTGSRKAVSSPCPTV